MEKERPEFTIAKLYSVLSGAPEPVTTITAEWMLEYMWWFHTTRAKALKENK